MSCDEGSAYVRCFKQIYDPISESNQEDGNAQQDDEAEIAEENSIPLDEFANHSVIRYDQEITDALNSFKQIELVNKLAMTQNHSDENLATLNLNLNELNHYRFDGSASKSFYYLEIEIGSNKISRIWCASVKSLSEWQLTITNRLKIYSKRFQSSLSRITNQLI